MTLATGSTAGSSNALAFGYAAASCSFLAPNIYGTVKVYADGRLILTRNLLTSGEQIRLPSGFKAQFWQIEFEARVKIYSVQMATSAKELRSV